jgi:hypothetical protein
MAGVYLRGGVYYGRFRHAGGGEIETSLSANAVDWASVAELCAACGGNESLREVLPESPFHREGVEVGTLVCKGCDNRRSDTPARIRARHSSSAAERPIQAGDWVECVDEGTGALVKLGQRYLVNRLSGRDSIVVVLEGGGHSTLWETRFKRVDGPHPEAMAPPALPLTPPPISPSAPTGTCLGCGADIGYAHRPGCTWAPKAEVKPTCSECGAAAKLSGGMCAYCDYSTDEGKVDRIGRDEFARCATETNPRRDKKAAERLEAMARAERPRVTRDAIEFRKPHPWSNSDE